MSGTAPVEETPASAPRPRVVRRPPLRTNLKWSLVSSAASAAANWLLIVVLARTTGSAAVGAYAFALALTAPVLGSGSLTGFQLRTLIASDPTERYTFREYRWASVLGAALGVIAVVAFAAVGRGHAANWAVLAPVIAMRAAEGLGEAYFGLWLVHERMRVLAISRVLQGAVAVALAGVATSLGGGAPAAAVAGAVGTITSLAYMHAAVRRDEEVRRAAGSRRHHFAWGRTFRIMREGLPLGIVVLLGVLQVNLPRYFVERSAGITALGFYAAASQLTTAGNMIVAAAAAAATPRLAAWYVAGERAYWTTTRKLVLGSLALGGAGVTLSVLFGREILTLLYGAEFGVAQPTLVVLSVAASLGFACAMLGLGLTSARVIGPQNAVLAVSLVILAPASWWLVPRLGELGAAWALVLATGAQAFGFLLALARMPFAARVAVATQG